MLIVHFWNMADGGRRPSYGLELQLKPARGMPLKEHLQELYGLLFPDMQLRRSAVPKDAPLGCCYLPSAVNFGRAANFFPLCRSSGRAPSAIDAPVPGRAICCNGLRGGPRRKQIWPKAKSGANQPIRIYRWLLAAVDGPGKKGMKCATHICGNAECLNISHLRWQSRKANVEDYRYHKEWHVVRADGNNVRFSRLHWPLP